jgi:mono/diheme cytochrome c family protein
LLETGRTDGQFADEFPFPITAEVMARGHERFDIFCSPCHGRLGNGDGMIVRRGFRRPPTFHQDRLRQVPPGYVFDVITNGFGAMPDYASQIPAGDRWAIVAYLKALQRSQHAPLADLPPSERARLEGERTRPR